MGIKDNPRRHLRNKVAAGGIGALLLVAGGYELYQRDLVIDRQANLIHEYQQQLDEQGSHIDQLKIHTKELKQASTDLTLKYNDLQDESVHLKDALEKQVADLESKDREIKRLEDELAFKQAKAKQAAVAAASTTQRSTTNTPPPSRGQEPAGKTITVESTGYIAMCKEGCTGITATGIDLRNNPHMKVIAVDPSVIPLGTKVHVPGYGYAIAGDTGGAIKGHKIDIHFPDTQTALNWGRRTIQIKILNQ